MAETEDKRRPERDPEAKAIARQLVNAPNLEAELAQASSSGWPHRRSNGSDRIDAPGPNRRP